MAERGTMTINDVAAILHMAPETVRLYMCEGLFQPPIGYVIMPKNRKRFRYIIPKRMLESYIGGSIK